MYPDIEKAVGGVKQVHRTAEILISNGLDAHIVQEDHNFHPNWFKSKVNTISRLDWIGLDLNPSRDILVIPETFVPAIKSLPPGIPIIIFNQNSSYTFGLPSKTIYKPAKIISLYNHESVKQVWCVSDYDYKFLANSIGVSLSKLYKISNSIDLSVFPLNISKINQISFMSRKNLLDSHVVVELLRKQRWLQDWQIKEISNVCHDEVFDILAQSKIFLSFGHPEGFGLPVAEALACGCAVVGYDGLGGSELFKIADLYEMSNIVAFGDWTGFIEKIFDVYSRYLLHPAYFNEKSQSMSKHIFNLYNYDLMAASVMKAANSLA